jgi:hypothetical protein
MSASRSAVISGLRLVARPVPAASTVPPFELVVPFHPRSRRLAEPVHQARDDVSTSAIARVSASNGDGDRTLEVKITSARAGPNVTAVSWMRQ